MVTTLEAQQGGAVQILEGGKRLRLEIEEFFEDNDVANLYLLALAELELEKDTLSADGKDDWWTHYSMASKFIRSSAFFFSRSSHRRASLTSITSYSWRAKGEVGWSGQIQLRTRPVREAEWVLHPCDAYVSYLASRIYRHVRGLSSWIRESFIEELLNSNCSNLWQTK